MHGICNASIAAEPCRLAARTDRRHRRQQGAASGRDGEQPGRVVRRASPSLQGTPSAMGTRSARCIRRMLHRACCAMPAHLGAQLPYLIPDAPVCTRTAHIPPRSSAPLANAPSAAASAPGWHRLQPPSLRKTRLSRHLRRVLSRLPHAAQRTPRHSPYSPCSMRRASRGTRARTAQTAPVPSARPGAAHACVPVCVLRRDACGRWCAAA